MTTSRSKPAATFDIADLSFRDREAAYAYFREMVTAQPRGMVFPEILDARFRALLARHPDADAKVGAGIRHFYSETGCYDVPELRIRRVDGSEDNVSVRKCIFGAPSPRVAVMRLLRAEVRDDIRRARQLWFRRNRHDSDPTRARCAVSGSYIRTDQGHMDHIPPMTFEVIGLTFLMHKGIDFADVKIDSGAPGRQAGLADRGLAAEWREWHARLAQLRFISNRHNHLDEAMTKLRRDGLRIPAVVREDGPDLYDMAV